MRAPRRKLWPVIRNGTLTFNGHRPCGCSLSLEQTLQGNTHNASANGEMLNNETASP